MSTILVVGGYGVVGSNVVKTLLKLNQESIIISGRSEFKALKFIDSLQIPNCVSFKKLDTNRPGPYMEEILNLAEVVIICSEQTNLNFVQMCLKNKRKVIDISASDEFHQKLENLGPVEGSAILSVGLAPGLTNLLVKEALSNHHNVERIDVNIMLGIGDSHGPQAIEWTIHNLIKNKDSNDKTVNYLAKWGKRRAYQFPFSDQYALKRTCGINVQTYLSFSSRLLTYFTLGLVGRLPRKIIAYMKRPLLLLGKFPLGKDKHYSVQIDVFEKGQVDPISMTQINGEQEALITGVFAALVGSKVLEEDIPNGVHHLHQLTSFNALWEDLKNFSGCELITSLHESF